MKDTLLTILRNKNTPLEEYRSAAKRFAYILAVEVSEHFEKERILIETPMAPTEGVKFINKLTLIPILRSGLALLNPFMESFPDAQIGFFGLKREEESGIANLYYENIPLIPQNHPVIVLEPMIATAGSAILAISRLLEMGVVQEQITVASIIASKVGKENLTWKFPDLKFVVGGVDESLNSQKYILPGLGDFGNRYFDTR